MAKIKIAFLIASMRMGGKEKLSRLIFEGLDRAQFDPFLCVMKGGELLEGLPPERVYSPLAAFRGDIPGYLARLGGVLRHERPQIVYCLSFRLVGAVGRILAKLGGSRTVYELHGVERAGQPMLEWPDRLLFDGLTDHYIAISSHLQAEYLRAGVGGHKISLIPNGVDTSVFTPQTLPREVWPGSGPVAACLANLRPEKNLPLLIEAFRLSLAQVPAARLMLIGEGSERPTLEAQIAAHGLGDHIRLLGARRDIPALLNQADVMALSSSTEAAPLSILEAQACGLPVVATAVGDVPRLIVEGETGFLVPSGDAGAMAERLARLLGDADLRARMGVAARQHVLQHYSFEQSLAARQELFLALAGQKKTRGG